jgi:transposase
MPTCLIYNQKSRNDTYVEIVDSVWDPIKKVKKRVILEIIGKKDRCTGEIHYTEAYLNRLKADGNDISTLKVWIKDNKGDQVTNKNIVKVEKRMNNVVDKGGVRIFFDKCFENIGIVTSLKAQFPKVWSKISALAVFMLTESKPFSKCQAWQEETGYDDVGSLASQRVSEILESIEVEKINGFFSYIWDNLVQPHEYVDVDGTSISTYSEHLENAEFGKNKDLDKLAQVNICLLFGSTSHLPISYHYYNGSITDTKIFNEIMVLLPDGVSKKRPLFIADKGFWSQSNVSQLFSNKYDFLIPITFVSKFANNIAQTALKTIEDDGKVIEDQKRYVQCKTIITKYCDKEMFVHVYFDPAAKAQASLKLKKKVEEAFTAYSENSKDKDQYIKYAMYLTFDSNDKSKVVSIDKNAIEKALEHEGIFMLASNYISNAIDAIKTYDFRNDVEVGFKTFKNMLGMHRIHVQSNEVANGKCFIAFIALLLQCYIKNTIEEQKLDMSVDKLISEILKTREISPNGKKTFGVLTALQEKILLAFKIDLKLFDVNNR